MWNWVAREAEVEETEPVELVKQYFMFKDTTACYCPQLDASQVFYEHHVVF